MRLTGSGLCQRGRGQYYFSLSVSVSLSICVDVLVPTKIMCRLVPSPGREGQAHMVSQHNISSHLTGPIQPDALRYSKRQNLITVKVSHFGARMRHWRLMTLEQTLQNLILGKSCLPVWNILTVLGASQVYTVPTIICWRVKIMIKSNLSSEGSDRKKTIHFREPFESDIVVENTPIRLTIREKVGGRQLLLHLETGTRFPTEPLLPYCNIQHNTRLSLNPLTQLWLCWKCKYQQATRELRI